MTQDQLIFLIGTIMGGLLAGTVCGLVPLAVGRWKRRVTLGVWALLFCMFSGGILGVILAVPVALIFSMITLVLGRPEEA